MAKKSPEEKAAEKRAASSKKAAATRAQNKAAASATANREQWEAQNPQRFEDLATAIGRNAQSDDQLNTKIKRAGLDPGQEIERQTAATRKMSPGLVYRAMGWTGGAENGANHPLQGTLFEDSRLMDNPSRWEDMNEKQRKGVVDHAARHGVTYESAYRAISTQLDRAHVREGGQHASFYSEEGQSQSGAMLPRTRLRTSAAQNDVDFHVQAAANAITSPQMRFVQTNKQTGAVNYPNDETATAAINWGKEGLSGEAYVKHPNYYVPPEDKVPGPKGKLVKRKDDPRKYPNQGYPENFGRAADVTSAVRGGAKVKDVWKPTDADKVKPYYNAWVAPHEPEGNFLVSDTHTGAAGFAPHLANTPAETTYLGKKGVHSWHDHIFRQVLHDRGLTSVSRNQSAQWGQEKTEQGHAGDLAELTRGHLAGTQFKQVDGQQELRLKF